MPDNEQQQRSPGAKSRWKQVVICAVAAVLLVQFYVKDEPVAKDMGFGIVRAEAPERLQKQQSHHHIPSMPNPKPATLPSPADPDPRPPLPHHHHVAHTMQDVLNWTGGAVTTTVQALHPTLHRVTGLTCVSTSGQISFASSGVPHGAPAFELLETSDLLVVRAKYPHVNLSALPLPLVLTDVVFWYGQPGRMDHLAHWLLHTVIPLAKVLLDHVHDDSRPFLLSTKTNGFASPFSAAFTHDREVVHPFIPLNSTTCFREAYFGLNPRDAFDRSINRANASDWFPEGSARRYFEEVRGRLWRRFVGVPSSLIGQAQGGRPLLLRITTRRGWGRNIVNVRELVQVVHNSFGAAAVNASGIDWEDYPLYEQLRHARDTDILVGVYGNNLGWMFLMRSGTVVLELCPFNCEAVTAGVNIALFKGHENSYFGYVGRRLGITVVSWQSKNESLSPLDPPNPAIKHPMRHRCRRKSKRRWMCRNLRLLPSVFVNLTAVSLSYIQNFSSFHQLGLAISDAS